VIRENLLVNILAYLHRALHVLLHFRANEYSHVLCMHLLMMNYWRQTNHPIWTAFTTDPRIFSEEKCEANLSAVAKHTSSDPLRFNVEHVEQTMLLVTHNRGRARELSTSGGQTLNPDGQEVFYAYAFLQVSCDELVSNECYMYPTGDPNAWTSADDMLEVRVPFQLDFPATQNLIYKFDQNVARCRRLTQVAWLQTVKAAIEDGLVDDPNSQRSFLAIVAVKSE